MNFELAEHVYIVSSTPNNYDHNVGYHDIKPFNDLNDNLIAIHRYPLNNLGFKENNNYCEICIWDHVNSIVDKIDTTEACSWEQGSRLQWINLNEIIYNKIIGNKLVSCIYNIETKKKTELQNSVYSYSKKTKKILTLNYSRIWSFWKSYGYFVPDDQSKYKEKPEDDGIFLTDINNNSKKLVLSIYDAVKICGLEKLKNTFFFLSFPSFSPNGDKFVSHLRFHLKSGALVTYFICTYLNESKNILLAREKVSHFEWIDNEKIIVWCRSLPKYLQKIRLNVFLEKYLVNYLKKIINKFKPMFKNLIKSEYYYLINLKKLNKITKVNEKILVEDGHPQISENGRFLVTDTYPDAESFQKLLIHDFKNNKTHYIGKFKVASYLIESSLKCDLHPRWNKKGNLLSIDSSHNGSKQTYVINIENFLTNIN